MVDNGIVQIEILGSYAIIMSAKEPRNIEPLTLDRVIMHEHLCIFSAWLGSGKLMAKLNTIQVAAKVVKMKMPSTKTIPQIRHFVGSFAV